MNPFDPTQPRDETCDFCRRDASECECPPCSVCGIVGDPKCATEHVPALNNPEPKRVKPCYRGNGWCPVGCCSHLFENRKVHPI